MRVAKSIAILIIFLFLVIPNPASASQENCKEIRQAQVQGKEFIQKGDKYKILRESIIQQCLLDAVKQTLGTEVRRNVGQSEKVVNDQITDKFDELTIEKVRGYISSYKIIREDITEKGAITLLEIDLEANVCVPNESQLQQVVVGGDFYDLRGSRSDKLRMVFLSFFPDSNKKLQLASYADGGGYRDIIVSGRVVDLSVTKGPKGGATGAAVIGTLLGGKLGGAIRQSGKGRVQKIKATVNVKAEMVADKATISVTREIEREEPLNADPGAASSSVLNQAIEEAASELFAKLTPPPPPPPPRRWGWILVLFNLRFSRGQ